MALKSKPLPNYYQISLKLTNKATIFRQIWV